MGGCGEGLGFSRSWLRGVFTVPSLVRRGGRGARCGDDISNSISDEGGLGMERATGAFLGVCLFLSRYAYLVGGRVDCWACGLKEEAWLLSAVAGGWVLVGGARRMFCWVWGMVFGL